MKRAICGVLAAVFIASGAPAAAQGTLRIGMTASDVPLTTGQTDQGGEGMRFMGYTVYDALINWDLSSATRPSGLVPGLATSWGLTPKVKGFVQAQNWFQDFSPVSMAR
jgi:hypothetical protein